MQRSVGSGPGLSAYASRSRMQRAVGSSPGLGQLPSAGDVWDIGTSIWGGIFGNGDTVEIADPSLPVGELTRALETLPNRAATIAEYIRSNAASLHHQPPSRQALRDPATLAREINTVTTWGDDNILNPQEKRIYDMAQAALREARQQQSPIERGRGAAEDVLGAQVPGWVIPAGIAALLLGPRLLG